MELGVRVFASLYRRSFFIRYLLFKSLFQRLFPFIDALVNVYIDDLSFLAIRTNKLEATRNKMIIPVLKSIKDIE